MTIDIIRERLEQIVDESRGKTLKETNGIKNKSYSSLKTSLKNNTEFESVKTAIDTIYPDMVENKTGIIKCLTNLYLLINKIDNIKKDSISEEEFKKITFNESTELFNFINDINVEYNDYKNVLNDFENLFNDVNWPTPMEVYIDNIKYDHYLFTMDLFSDEIPLDENIGNDDVLSSESAAHPNKLAYWQKYCGIATLVNCMQPQYWATGLLLLGVPIPMPIILIPFTYIDGKVSAVIGIGICGMWILPMMLVINQTDQLNSALIPIYQIIDTTMESLKSFKQMQYKSIKLTTKPMIDTLNKKINGINDEIRELKKQIALYKNL